MSGRTKTFRSESEGLRPEELHAMAHGVEDEQATSGSRPSEDEQIHVPTSYVTTTAAATGAHERVAYLVHQASSTAAWCMCSVVCVVVVGGDSGLCRCGGFRTAPSKSEVPSNCHHTHYTVHAPGCGTASLVC